MISFDIKSLKAQWKSASFRIITLAFFNLCALSTTYFTFLIFPHYSTDTYKNFVNPVSNVEINVQHGRYISAVIYKLFDLFNFDYSQHAHLGSFLLSLVLSICIAILAQRFWALSESQTTIRLFTVDIVLLSLGLNLSIMEILLFPDTVFSGTVCYLFLYLSVLFWCKPNRRWHDHLISFIFLCLNLDMYQVCIGFYVIVCLAYTFLYGKFQDGKKIMLHTMLNLAIGLAASIQSLLLMKLPELLGQASTTYVAPLSLSSVLNNAKQIFASQFSLWFGFSGFLPRFAPALLFFAAILILVLQLLKRCIPLMVMLLCFLALCGSWFMAYAPYFIADTVWMPPRTLISMFALIALPGIWSSVFGSRHHALSSAAVYSFLMVVMSIGIQRISVNNIASNKIDQEIAGIIIHKIESYESTSGQTIDTIAVHSDPQLRYGYDSIAYTILDTNLRSYCTSWSDVSTLEYFSDRDFSRIEMSEEEYTKRFGDKNWDYFDSTEQIQFDGSTMYWAIY